MQQDSCTVEHANITLQHRSRILGVGGGGGGKGSLRILHGVWAISWTSLKITEWLGMYVFILFEHQASVLQEIQVTGASVNE